MSIVVTARIEDLRDVKEHLNRLQDVEELMQEAIGEVVRQYLHTIDPERFYVRFSFADKKQEKRSIEEELKSLITERLKKGFAADIISVTPKMVDTDLIERLRKLRNEICNFKVEVHPLDASEPVTFCGAFQIEGVSINEQNGSIQSGWYTFQEKNHEIAKIKEHIEQTINTKLSTRPIEWLRYKADDHLEEIRQETEAAARETAIRLFGLVVSFTDFSRILTGKENRIRRVEDAQDEARENELITRIETLSNIVNFELKSLEDVAGAKNVQLEKLLVMRTQAISVDGKGTEVQELDEKISNLQKDLSELSREINERAIIDEKNRILPSASRLRADRALSKGGAEGE